MRAERSSELRDSLVEERAVGAWERFSAQSPALLRAMADARAQRASSRAALFERAQPPHASATSAVAADAFGDRRFAGRVVQIGRRFGRRNIRTDDPSERLDTKILEVVLALDVHAGLLPGQRVTGFVRTSTAQR